MMIRSIFERERSISMTLLGQIRHLHQLSVIQLELEEAGIDREKGKHHFRCEHVAPFGSYGLPWSRQRSTISHPLWKADKGGQ